MDSTTRKYSLGDSGPSDTTRVPVILARLVLALGWISSLAAWAGCGFVYATIDNSVGDLSVPLPRLSRVTFSPTAIVDSDSPLGNLKTVNAALVP
jgi:hypothetical protein